MNLTLNEKIDLIVGFSKFSKGYWKHLPITSQIVSKFIDAGFASLDTEHQEKYVLTPKGIAVLQPCIDEIHNTLVTVSKNKLHSLFSDEAINTIVQTYGVDFEIAEKLYYHIISIGEINGYVCSIFSQGNRRGVEFKKVN